VSTRIRHTTTTVRVQAAGARTRVRNVQQVTRIRVGGVGAPIARGVKYLSRWPGTDRTGATDCGTAVQAAITAWGGTYTIVVDGVFKCTSEPLDLPSGTQLIAARPGVDGFTFGWSLASSGTYYLGNSTTDGTVSGIRLEGLKITGAGDGTPWGSNQVSGTPVNGIKLLNVTDCVIDGCVLYRVPGIAINYAGVRGMLITNNRISECGRDGISGFYTATGGFSNVRIADNEVWLNGDDGIVIWADSDTLTNGTAATVATTANSTAITGSGTSWTSADVGKTIVLPTAGVDGNLLETTIAAVASTTSATLTHPASVTVASESATYGIVRPTNYAIVGNVIRSANVSDALGGNRAIALRGCGFGVVSGNTTSESFGAALEVGPASSNANIYSRNVTVTGNTFDRGGYYGGTATRRQGIDLRYAIECTITGNVVTRSYGDGISAIYTQNCSIVGNTVSESGDYGIRANGQNATNRANRGLRIANNTVTRSYSGGIRSDQSFVHIVDNECNNNGTNGGLAATDYGIYLSGQGDALVVGNRCTDTRATGAKTQAGGIYVSAAYAGQAIVIGNILTGTAGTALFRGTTFMEMGNLCSTSNQALNHWAMHTGVEIHSGSGSPESAVSAPVGSLYLRSDGSAGTSFYVKESGTGNTGWSTVGGMSAAAILAALVTVDGAGSGLDADLLDGQSSAYYATASSVSDHLADTVDAHDASAISYAGSTNLAATDVEAALDELDGEKVAKAGDTMAGPLLLPNGTASNPALGFSTDPDTGLVLIGDAVMGQYVAGARIASWEASLLRLSDAVNIALNTSTGTKLGTSTTQKLGFWNATPVVRATVTGTNTLTVLDSLLSTLATYGLIADTTGTLVLADGDIPSTIARDTEVTAAITTHAADTDPHGDRAYALGLVDDLSGVSNAPTARTNLGLGGSATLNVGTTAGTVAAGDHNHSGVYDPAGTAAAAVSTHEGLADPHPGYLLESAAGDLALLDTVGAAQIDADAVGASELAVDAVVDENVAAAANIAGSKIAAATDTTRGAVELATAAEVLAGTDTSRAVTPAGAGATYPTFGRAVMIAAGNYLP